MPEKTDIEKLAERVRAVRLTASGLVSNSPTLLFAVSGVSVGAAGYAWLFDGTDNTGDMLLYCRSAADYQFDHNFNVPLPFPHGIYVTLSGAVYSCTLVILDYRP